QRAGTGDGDLDARGGSDHSDGIGALVPRTGRAAADADVGPDAGRGTRLLDGGRLDRRLPGPRDSLDCARGQLAWGRTARSARPAPAAAHVDDGRQSFTTGNDHALICSAVRPRG